MDHLGMAFFETDAGTHILMQSYVEVMCHRLGIDTNKPFCVPHQGAAEPGAEAADLMTQSTETAAPIASVNCFRCSNAQRFHAAVLTSARVPIFGLLKFIRPRLLLLISVIRLGVRAG